MPQVANRSHRDLRNESIFLRENESIFLREPVLPEPGWLSPRRSTWAASGPSFHRRLRPPSFSKRAAAEHTAAKHTAAKHTAAGAAAAIVLQATLVLPATVFLTRVSRSQGFCSLVVFLLFTLGSAVSACGWQDRELLRQTITLLREEEPPEQRLGNTLVEAVDGSILFEDELGHLLLLRKEEIIERSAEQMTAPLADAALERRLVQELPPDFKILQTRHYTFCYWTEQDYAQWVSVLYERLYAGFNNYWDNRGFETQEAEHPLIVLIFKDRPQYERFARVEMKAEPTGIIGYYHVLHNWVVMYDLTADGQFAAANRSLNQVLSHPNAIPMVATIVHEATHQLMFNNGMQQRLADIPLWVSEGLAVYFEAPDLSNAKGWKGIGKINILRYQRAKQYLRQRPADSLQTLLQDDKRFRDPSGNLDAYAEAWALNFFLLKKYRKQYQSYLQSLSERKPLNNASAEQRIELFVTELGKPLAEIDREFVEFLYKLR